MGIVYRKPFWMVNIERLLYCMLMRIVFFIGPKRESLCEHVLPNDKKFALTLGPGPPGKPGGPADPRGPCEE